MAAVRRGRAPLGGYAYGVFTPDAWRHGPTDRADQFQEDRDQGPTRKAEGKAGEKTLECLMLGSARIDSGEAEEGVRARGRSGPLPRIWGGSRRRRR